MVPYLRAEAGAGVGGEDDAGGLIGEMAVDAVARKRAAAARKQSAAFHFVTGETTLGKVLDLALWRVDVVTCRTSHI